jgi:hypothetical protein
MKGNKGVDENLGRKMVNIPSKEHGSHIKTEY